MLISFLQANPNPAVVPSFVVDLENPYRGASPRIAQIYALDSLSKHQTRRWLPLALLGPIGLAVLASLRNLGPGPPDLYERLNRRLNLFFRVAYEIGFFMLVGTLSWQLMSFKHQAMISLHSAMTGLSRGQALEQQNDQSAMWAFSELNDVVYFLVLLYLLRPVCVNLVGSLFKHREPSEAACQPCTGCFLTAPAETLATTPLAPPNR